jgi:uncharacterized LabA/DUF88 family protein
MVYKKKSKKYGKTIALIDAANIIYANKYLEWSIDHRCLIKYLKERFGVKRVIYYAGLEKEDNEKENFYKKIKKFGFKTKIKPVAIFKGKYYWKNFKCPRCKKRISKKFQGPPIKKANCDVDLTIDAINFSQTYDTLLLFSGDGDFSSLVDYLKKKGKKTIIFSSIENCAKRLRQAAFAFIEINQLKDILELKVRKK